MIEWILKEAENGLTALELLQGRAPAAPPAYLRQLLRKGKVRRGDAPLAEDSLLRAGDRLNLPDSRRLRQLLEAVPVRQPEILFENSELLVVFKPAGMAVHRGVGHERGNLADYVQAMMKGRGAPFRTAPVHRLDAETSGPVLFGKGRRATSELGKLFMAGKVEKTYLALATGTLTGSGTLRTPVPAKGKLKPAATDYRVLGGCAGFTLLELHLHSGRTHQIRRQLADAGHPLAGDGRYRGETIAGLKRLFLHCRSLVIAGLLNGLPLAVDCPLPEELEAVLETLGVARIRPR